MPQTIPQEVNLLANTNRGPSASIWGKCPILDFLQDPGYGQYFFDDFTVAGNAATLNAIGNFGQWASWFDTGTVLTTDPQQDGGVIRMLPTSTTTMAIGSTAGSFRMVTAAAGNAVVGGKMWFECRIALSSITTAIRDVFIGLVDNTTQFSTASATAVINTTNILATGPNLFGFHARSTTNPTDVGLAFNVAGGTVQYPTNLQTLSTTVTGAALTAFAAGATGALGTGFVKLGFVFDPQAQPKRIGSASSGQTLGALKAPLITIYVNGIAAAAFLTSDNLVASTFPTGWMAPFIGISGRGTSPSLLVDWIRVAQMAQS